MEARSNRSMVWGYFKNPITPASATVQCKICQDEIGRGGTDPKNWSMLHTCFMVYYFSFSGFAKWKNSGLRV